MVAPKAVAVCFAGVFVGQTGRWAGRGFHESLVVLRESFGLSVGNHLGCLKDCDSPLLLA